MKDRFNVYKSKFFYLLCLLILYCIITSLEHKINQNALWVGLIFSCIIFFCVLVIPHEKILLFHTIILGFTSITCHWVILNLNQPPQLLLFIFYASNILFLSVITGGVLYAVTKHQEITADTLFGAVCGYFLIGFIWSFIYILISQMNPNAFSNLTIGSSIHDNEEHFFYYSYTTLTTLGYGDILPISAFARTCSWLEALSGQIYLAVWISQLVGIRIMQKNQSKKTVN